MTKFSKGTCLCGAVTLSVAKLGTAMGACHSGMCRKWGGGPMLTLDGGNELKIEGQDSVTTYQSSDWAERSFCKKCGTHLFYRLKAKSKYFLPAGFFGEQELDFDHQIFIDKKPNYYAFSNQTKNMTEAEVFAAFANKG